MQLNAKTGQLIAAFGKGGMVDLKEGVVYGKKVNGKWQQVQIPLVEGEIGTNSTPLVAGDIIVVQSAMAEGLRYEYANNAKGLVRAYDVRTGKQLWRFDTMPGPGEPGHETWEGGSWNWTGNTGVWTEVSADVEAGLVYLPVESPTIDAYGGNRPGNNLYAESLVAVDLKTGKKKWHYQITHHPLWDYDLTGAPLLMNVTIDGKPRKIVGQPSKQGWLYAFDRITGEPIWPIVEKPVPQSNVPGEKTSPTQPFPTKPPQYSRNYLATDQVIDFTPALRAKALENLKKYRWEQTPFVPYVVPNDTVLGSIQVGNTMGGVNWPGSSFNPETGVFFTQANNSSVGTGAFSHEYFEHLKPESQAAAGHIAIWEAPGFAQPGFEAPTTSGYRAPTQPGGGGGGGGGGNPLYRRSWRAADHQAAVWRDHGARHEHRQPQVAGAPRRHARRGAQQPDAEGHDHPQDRPDRHRGRRAHQDPRHRGRPTGDLVAGAAAWRDAARVRPADGRRSRRRVAAVGPERQPDDLHGGWPPVHHRGRGRRHLLQRVRRLCAAAKRDQADDDEVTVTTRTLTSAVAAFTATWGLAVLAAQPTRSVWDGVYSEAQATRGAVLYDTECAKCHGAEGAGGGMAPALTGAAFSANYDGQTVGDLAERNRTTMPPGKEGQLSAQDNADIVAAMLKFNQFPVGESALPAQTMALKMIQYLAQKP